jgi:Sensors of blue-light using FAD
MNMEARRWSMLPGSRSMCGEQESATVVTQLIYMSEPFGYDDNILTTILATARRKNARDGITGALICRQDIYLQLIEGDAAAIDALFARILADDRHLAVTLLSRVDVADRLFPTWAMLHDPAHTWLWSAEDVAGGAVREAAPATLQQVFVRAALEAARA